MNIQDLRKIGGSLNLKELKKPAALGISVIFIISMLAASTASAATNSQALIFSSGFEDGFSSWTSTYGGVSVVSSSVYSGIYSMKCSDPWGSQATKSIGINSETYTEAEFYFDQNFAGSQTLITYFNVNGAPSVSMGISVQSSKVFVFVEDRLPSYQYAQYKLADIIPGTWYKFALDASATSASIYMNNQKLTSVSQENIPATASVNLGMFWGDGAYNGNLYVDSVQISTSPENNSTPIISPTPSPSPSPTHSSTPSSTPKPTTTPTLTTLPFTDNFANLNAWTITDGTWTLISGGAQGSSASEALMYSGSKSWTNYQIMTPVIMSSGAEASIVFRFSDSNNYYWAGLGCWGHQYSISKVIDGVYSEITSSGIASSNSAGTYTLKIIAQGNTITLNVNGVSVLMTTDTALVSGAIGLRTYGSTMEVGALTVSTVAPSPTLTQTPSSAPNSTPTPTATPTPSPTPTPTATPSPTPTATPTSTPTPTATPTPSPTPSTVVSTELINFYSMSSSEVSQFIQTVHTQGIPMLTLRLNAMTEYSSGTSSGINKAKEIIGVANQNGIECNVDLHTWYTTWDNYFQDSASGSTANRAQYITYVRNVLSAFSGTNVYAFMVLNEPQARTASSSENQFILDIISAAHEETARPVSVRFMCGYSPSTGHYSASIDVVSDFLCRNSYWDPQNPSVSVYGTTQAKMNTAVSTAHNQGKDIWFTEFGKTNSNLEIQRAYVEAFVSWAKSNSVDAIFCWVSQPESGGETYNIFNGYTPNPAFYELVN